MNTSLRPPLVVLCGSTRFKDAFFRVAQHLELLEEKICLLPPAFGHADGITWTQEQNEAFDRLHRKKIDLAHEVYIIDVDGYVGVSTRGEIEYATQLGKPLRYLSQEKL